MELRTRRLRLLAATAESVQAELEDPGRLAKLLGARVPDDWPPVTLRDVLPTFLARHREHPDWTGWLGWYAVRLDQADPVLCGSLGFKGPPDAEGTAEIGYSVLPDHQHRGLATEAVAGLVEWAQARPDLLRIEAETTADNRASIRVLERNGFRLAGSGPGAGSLRYRRP